jgi:hypothetical protein
MYLFSALDKTNLTFLSGAQLERYLLWFYFGSSYPESAALRVLVVVLSVGVVLLEYALALGMLFERARRRLVILGLLMHGAFYALLPVSTYTATVWLLYLAYFDPDEVERFIDRLHGYPRKRRAKRAGQSSVSTTSSTRASSTK